MKYKDFFIEHKPLNLHSIENKLSKLLIESLVLKRGENNLIIVTSDKPDQKDASNETFRNKNALKDAGFKWNVMLNAWTIPENQLEKAVTTITKINKSPLSQLITKIEDLPEFVLNSDSVSRKQELATKIEGFIDELAAQVDSVKANKMILDFLNFNKRFRTYSFSNTVLIYIQKPNATRVAGFNAWKKMNRYVKSGAKAITIFAPRTPPKKLTDKEPEKEGDSTTGTDLETAIKKKNTINFIAVNVFDISDTEPMNEKGNIPSEPEWHDKNTPSETADKLFEYAKEFVSNIGINLSSDASKRGEQGWANQDHINISSDIAGINKLSTLIHEIAHSLIHFKSSSIFFGDEDTENATKQQKELQAETISYAVLKHYDLPVVHHATYIALWGGNKESVKSNLQIIKKTSNFIIDGIDKVATAHAETTPKV